MLVKTDSWKRGDILVWNVPLLKKSSKPEELKSFILEHGGGPFFVSMDYVVHADGESVRWLNIKSCDISVDKIDLTKVDESCFVQAILANSLE